MKKTKIMLMLCMLTTALSACAETGRQTADNGQGAEESLAADENQASEMNQNVDNGQGAKGSLAADEKQTSEMNRDAGRGQDADERQTAKDNQDMDDDMDSAQDDPFTEDDSMQDELEINWGNGDIYATAEYGNMEVIRLDCLDEDGAIAYYYVLECFYFYDEYPEALNQGLREFYSSYEAEYQEYADDYGTLVEETFGEADEHTPYDQMCCMGLYYVGEDYVSLLYNGISFMGGAHPYSRYEGVTIDRSTGERVSASRVLGRSDDDILQEVSARMGLEVLATWDDVDFYLTDVGVVFCYRMPGFYEDVVLPLP